MRGGGTIGAQALQASPHPFGQQGWVLGQRHTTDALARPEPYGESGFGDNAVLVRQGLGEPLEYLGPQRHCLARVSEFLGLGSEPLAAYHVAHTRVLLGA